MTQNPIDWDDLYMTIAFAFSMKSKDKNTRVGAVIVDPTNAIVSGGYNGLPRGLNDHKPERFDRPLKYVWFEHAERNAIYNAASIGVSTRGCRLYVTMCPCMDCARAVIQSGITEIVINKLFTEAYAKATPDHNWKIAFENAASMLTEAGVAVRWYERVTPVVQGFLNGAPI